MYVAGYSFQILNNAFASHWGFQTMKQRPVWRARQQVSISPYLLTSIKKLDCFIFASFVSTLKQPNFLLPLSYWMLKLTQEENNAKFDNFAMEISNRYGHDPYNMSYKLKGMNLKNSKVAYS